MNASERRHVEAVAQLGCVVCRRFGSTGLPVEIHHVAEGSGLRTYFAIAPLCGGVEGGHHRGANGLHGMGTKKFCSAYRLPGESEWGLLVWVNEDLARMFLLARRLS